MWNWWGHPCEGENDTEFQYDGKETLFHNFDMSCQHNDYHHANRHCRNISEDDNDEDSNAHNHKSSNGSGGRIDYMMEAVW